MKILFVPRSRDATAHYRCEIPAKNLRLAGHEVRINYSIEKGGASGLKRSDVDWAEVIVVQRAVTADEVRTIAALKSEPDKLIFGDYDDDYDNVPKWNPGYTYVMAHREEWRQALPLFDGIIVSTEPLKELVQQYTSKPIYVIKNGMDVEEIDSVGTIETHHAERMRITPEGAIAREEKIPLQELNKKTEGMDVIGWFGSRSHYCDIDWLPEQLAELMDKDPKIFCIFVGYTNWRFVANLPEDRFWMAPGIVPVINYWRLLKTIRIDVSLAPVDPIPFNRSKSAIKVWESMLMNMYPIASEFDTYENEIHEGMLAGYRYGDWIAKISEAVALKRENPAEFSRRVVENQRWVREFHDARHRPIEYEAAFSDALEKKYDVSDFIV